MSEQTISQRKYLVVRLNSCLARKYAIRIPYQIWQAGTLTGWNCFSLANLNDTCFRKIRRLQGCGDMELFSMIRSAAQVPSWFWRPTLGIASVGAVSKGYKVLSCASCSQISSERPKNRRLQIHVLNDIFNKSGREYVSCDGNFKCMAQHILLDTLLKYYHTLLEYCLTETCIPFFRISIMSEPCWAWCSAKPWYAGHTYGVWQHGCRWANTHSYHTDQSGTSFCLGLWRDLAWKHDAKQKGLDFHVNLNPIPPEMSWESRIFIRKQSLLGDPNCTGEHRHLKRQPLFMFASI